MFVVVVVVNFAHLFLWYSLFFLWLCFFLSFRLQIGWMFISPTVSGCYFRFVIWTVFFFSILFHSFGSNFIYLLFFASFIVFFDMKWSACASREKEEIKDYFVHTYISFLLFTNNFTIKPQNNSKINKIQIRNKYKCIYVRNENGSMWNEWRYANGTLSPRLHELYHTHEKKTQLRFLKKKKIKCSMKSVRFLSFAIQTILNGSTLNKCSNWLACWLSHDLISLIQT